MPLPSNPTEEHGPGPAWQLGVLWSPTSGSPRSCLEPSQLAKQKVQAAPTAQGTAALSLGSLPVTSLSPLTSATSLFAACSLPHFCQQTSKGAFNSSLFVKPACFDRSVAEDERNRQTGAITPSQLLPTLGLMVSRSPCLQSCLATTLRPWSHRTIWVGKDPQDRVQPFCQHCQGHN